MENESTPTYFIQVPLDLLSGYDLTPTDYLIFGQIYTMLNVTHKCFMSNASIGKKLGIKANTVQKSISKMKKMGLLNTTLIYKDGSKEVDKRFITLPPVTYITTPHGRQSPTPRDENHGGGGRESTDNRLLNRLDEYISSSSGDDFVDEKPVENKSLTTYEQLWGFPNAIARDDLLTWINDYSDELVNYAIEIAGHNNVSSSGAYKYLDAILTAWKKDSITTIEQAKKQNKEHSNRMDREYKSRKNYSKPVKRETIPEDWGKHDQAKPVDADKAKALKERIARLRNKGDK